MYEELKSINWQEVEAFFYQAMLQGWASDTKVEVDMDTGYKTWQFAGHTASGTPLVLTDRWTKTPDSCCSSGTTTICLGVTVTISVVPIWTMHYGGRYPEGVTILVKNALKKVYMAQHEYPFMGCRGPAKLEAEGIVYHNWVDYQDPIPFRCFSGIEKVVAEGDVEVGYHEYFGMALI